MLVRPNLPPPDLIRTAEIAFTSPDSCVRDSAWLGSVRLRIVVWLDSGLVFRLAGTRGLLSTWLEARLIAAHCSGLGSARLGK